MLGNNYTRYSAPIAVFLLGIVVGRCSVEDIPPLPPTPAPAQQTYHLDIDELGIGELADFYPVHEPIECTTRTDDCADADTVNAHAGEFVRELAPATGEE